MWLATECWVEILKLFSRRELIDCLQPVSRRLRDICELHVPTRHALRRFGRFLEFLTNNLWDMEQTGRDQIAATLDRHYAIGTSQNAGFTLRQIGMGEQQRDVYQVGNYGFGLCDWYYDLDILEIFLNVGGGGSRITIRDPV